MSDYFRRKCFTTFRGLTTNNVFIYTDNNKILHSDNNNYHTNVSKEIKHIISNCCYRSILSLLHNGHQANITERETQFFNVSFSRRDTSVRVKRLEFWYTYPKIIYNAYDVPTIDNRV